MVLLLSIDQEVGAAPVEAVWQRQQEPLVELEALGVCEHELMAVVQVLKQDGGDLICLDRLPVRLELTPGTITYLVTKSMPLTLQQGAEALKRTVVRVEADLTTRTELCGAVPSIRAMHDRAATIPRRLDNHPAATKDATHVRQPVGAEDLRATYNGIVLALVRADQRVHLPNRGSHHMDVVNVEED